jgi:hypothetical protein
VRVLLLQRRSALLALRPRTRYTTARAALDSLVSDRAGYDGEQL